MGDNLPKLYLARHGETAWTVTGQRTGRKDLPLTEHGECQARKLAERLQGRAYVKVFTSPLQRARRTCELSGFGAVAEIDPDLTEWNYGPFAAALPEHGCGPVLQWPFSARARRPLARSGRSAWAVPSA